MIGTDYKVTANTTRVIINGHYVLFYKMPGARAVRFFIIETDEVMALHLVNLVTNDMLKNIQRTGIKYIQQHVELLRTDEKTVMITVTFI